MSLCTIQLIHTVCITSFGGTEKPFLPKNWSIKKLILKQIWVIPTNKLAKWIWHVCHTPWQNIQRHTELCNKLTGKLPYPMHNTWLYHSSLIGDSAGNWIQESLSLATDPYQKNNPTSCNQTLLHSPSCTSWNLLETVSRLRFLF
jgi:hypothetical protein